MALISTYQRTRLLAINIEGICNDLITAKSVVSSTVSHRNLLHTAMVEDKNTDNCVLGGKVLANPPPGDEIVISGVSSAFPSAMNVHEIRDKLLNKVKMVAVGHRWDFKDPALPTSTGLLPEIDKYDAGFFVYTNDNPSAYLTE
ncbi:hypothetical protein NQ318_004672 [Aromia moschata]|uniref:Uncharacterized protein n=1 Tax=Aromia moschata TaxID=1265417 RepID=A0AAV8Y515_9CUCU|nr:hypothetical protein NQ318_004672 [Aromia moschata]